MQNHVRILVLLLSVFCFADVDAVGSVSAAVNQTFTVSVADKGGVPNDAANDGVAFQDALVEIGNSGQGGTILVPPGRWVISTPVSSTTLGGKSIRFLGTGNDSVIVVKTPSIDTFYLANAETVTFENLTFVTGDSSTVNDADHVIRIDVSKFATVKDCNFYGISTIGSSTSSAIWFVASVGVLERVGFFGSASQSRSVVLYSLFRGVSVRNVVFLDYGDHNGTFYSKTPLAGLTGSWLEVREPSASPQNASTNGAAVDIQNFVGDEGAAAQILLNPAAGGTGRRIHAARLVNINGNVAGTVGTGISANDVDVIDIEHSWFGYTSTNVSAVRLRNCSKATLYGVTLGQGVNRYDIDDTNTYAEIISSSTSSTPCAALTCKVAVSYGDLATAGNLSGAGTPNKLTKWAGTDALGNSSISDNGSTVSFSNSGNVTFNNSGAVTFANTGGVNLSSTMALPITTSSADHFVLGPAHSVLLVDATNGLKTNYLPNAATNVGKIYTIKKIDGSANSVKIESKTFSKGTASIDNQHNWFINARYGSITVISDGQNWWIIAKT